MTRDEVTQAVASGWCTKKNEHKEMDTDLAVAIVDAVLEKLDTMVLPEKELFKRIRQTRITCRLPSDDIRKIITALAEPSKI